MNTFQEARDKAKRKYESLVKRKDAGEEVEQGWIEDCQRRYLYWKDYCDELDSKGSIEPVNIKPYVPKYAYTTQWDIKEGGESLPVQLQKARKKYAFYFKLYQHHLKKYGVVYKTIEALNESWFWKVRKDHLFQLLGPPKQLSLEECIKRRDMAQKCYIKGVYRKEHLKKKVNLERLKRTFDKYDRMVKKYKPRPVSETKHILRKKAA